MGRILEVLFDPNPNPNPNPDPNLLEVPFDPSFHVVLCLGSAVINKYTNIIF